MNDTDAQILIQTLQEIRDNQKLQIERQQEALQVQREQFAMVRAQNERAMRLQDRAEVLQEKSGQIVGAARKVFIVVLPILIALIAYVSWLLFRR
ncbi:MAG: hypothetical protein ACKVP2_09165 [Burkholderiales bacterium]